MQLQPPIVNRKTKKLVTELVTAKNNETDASVDPKKWCINQAGFSKLKSNLQAVFAKINSNWHAKP